MKKILPLFHGIIWKKRFLLALMAGLLAAPMAWMYFSVPRPRLRLKTKPGVGWDFVFSPDSRRLAFKSGDQIFGTNARILDGTIQVWNLDMGEELLCIPHFEYDPAVAFGEHAMGFTPDSKTLAVYDLSSAIPDFAPNKIDFYNLVTGKKLDHSFQVKIPRTGDEKTWILGRNCLGLGGNGELLILQRFRDRQDSQTRYAIRHVPTRQQVGAIELKKNEYLKAHTAAGLVTTTIDNQQARLWHLPSGKLRWRVTIPSKEFPSDWAATPDGETLVYVADAFVCVWDESSPDGRRIPICVLSGDALSPDGKTLVVCPNETPSRHPLLVQLLGLCGVTLPPPRGRLCMYDLRTGRRLTSFSEGTWEPKFSPDGKTLAIICSNKDEAEVQIYDIPLPNPIWNTFLYTLLAMAATYGLGTGIKHASIALRRPRKRQG